MMVTYGLREYVFQVHGVKGACPNDVVVQRYHLLWYLSRSIDPVRLETNSSGP
jgi:hypothetical protein